MTNSELKKLTSFFFEVGTLRKIIRMHRQVFLTDDLSDSIASHSFRVAVIGYFLAREVENANPEKVLIMCLLHDIAETRSGDQNWIHKRYVKVFEDEIIKDQLKNIPRSAEVKNTIKEYEERKTINAKVAKDADLIDQVLLIREYAWQGNKEAKSWLKGPKEESNSEKLMSTPLAKKIAEEIKTQDPHDWWAGLETPKRR